MQHDSKALDFLAGGGELGALIRAFDWSKSPIGPAAQWPQSLKTAVRIMLTSRQPIWIGWGQKLIYLYNDAYKSIIGGKHPRMLGQPTSVVWREIWDQIAPMLSTALGGSEGTYVEEQFLIMERNGYPEETYYTFSYSPIPDDDGTPGGIFCANTDATRNVIAERQLALLKELAAVATNARGWRESCERSADALATNSRDLPFALIYLAEPGGQDFSLAAASVIARGSRAAPISVANDDASTWPLAKALQRSDAALIGDLDAWFGNALPSGAWIRPPSHAALLSIPASGDTGRGGVLVVGLNPFRLFDENYRSFLGLVAGQISASIASAQAYEDERRRAEALIELDRAKTAFFSNVSHELRTPLTLILGPVDDLLSTNRNELSWSATEKLDLVSRNAARLLRLVNRLLDFSRLEAGRVTAVYEPTDLAAATRELAGVFRAATERAGLVLAVDCTPLSQPVYIDRDMWEKIVLNLLSNAFKFTFDGEIAVTLRDEGTHAVLKVRDTGTGIPEEDMLRLFERFHRVEGARGRTHEGSGIGLALVAELVRLHGGEISAQSHLDEGSTFTVRVPFGTSHLAQSQIGEAQRSAGMVTGAAPYVQEALNLLPEPSPAREIVAEERAAQDDEKTLPAPSQEVRPRVLFADDNADMRAYVARLLERDYDVETVPDGEAALAAIRERAPQLVLTDVMMPRLDGFGLLQALRADPTTKGIPIIMLSARAGEESRVEGIKAGADDYVVKPFNARELLARVSARLEVGRLQARLEEERTRLADLFAQTPLPTAVLHGPELVFEIANHAFIGVIGGRDIVGVSLLEAMPEIQGQGFDDLLREVMRTGTPYVGREVPFKLERNERIEDTYFTFIYAPLRNADGTIDRVICIANEVTAEVRARQVVLETEQRFRRIADTAPAMLWISDPDGACSFRSRRWHEFTRQSREEALGFGWLDALHPQDRDSIERAFIAANERREAINLDYRLRSRDEGYRWVIDTASPRLDENGEFQGYVGSVIDVDERWQAQEAQRASNEQVRAIFGQTKIGIAQTDLTGRFTLVNPPYCALVGRPADQLYGLRMQDITHPDDLASNLTRFTHLAATGEPFTIEKRYVRPDGSYVWVRNNVSAIRDAEGAPSAIVALSIDMTESKALEAALTEADRRKDVFLAVLAHELRNPLAAMRQAATIATLPSATPAQVKWTQGVIERQLKQMALLLDDLLDVSRIKRDKLRLRKSRIALKDAVDAAVETARPQIEEREHALAITLPGDPVWIDADPLRLSQVLDNLLTNAAKYTPQRGRIALSARREAADAVIEVSDSGIGIAADQLTHVFEMFSQLESALNRAEGGLGIGLALTRGLVELHGGTIVAKSEGPGRGSTFSVRLPTAVIDPARSRTTSPQAPITPLPPRRILVADDNKDAAVALALYLELQGHAVRTAHDGVEALEIAQAFRPEIALLDIGMPKLNGYDVARRMRGEPWGANSTLIAVTGWGQEEDKQRAASAGFSHHLTKPVSEQALMSVLAQA